MKKITSLLLSSLLLTSASLSAFNYTISFTGSGAASSIDSVVVQNLTKSTRVKVPAGNVLNLTDQSSGVNDISGSDNSLRISPNPIQSEAEVSFYVPFAGAVTVDVLSLQGAKLASLTRQLAGGSHTFRLALPQGSYLVNVQGRGFSHSAKVVSVGKVASQAILTYAGLLQGNKATSTPQKAKAETAGITTMTYTTGDQLLYKAYSGNGVYCTIVTDVPEDSKTTNFNFVDCTDADGNHYATVTIGTQTWMAENLKTMKYQTGEAIANVTDNTAWTNLTTGAWCTYGNTLRTDSINKFGRLYNWYAAVDARNIAPAGWHVPTDAEWTTLTNYVNANPGTSGNAAKALAATTDWRSFSTIGTVGCNPTKNNSSGFGALPSGGRNNNGVFCDLADYGFWWVASVNNSSSARYRDLDYYNNNVYPISSTTDNTSGFSVCCVRD